MNRPLLRVVTDHCVAPAGDVVIENAGVVPCHEDRFVCLWVSKRKIVDALSQYLRVHSVRPLPVMYQRGVVSTQLAW